MARLGASQLSRPLPLPGQLHSPRPRSVRAECRRLGESLAPHLSARPRPGENEAGLILSDSAATERGGGGGLGSYTLCCPFITRPVPPTLPPCLNSLFWTLTAGHWCAEPRRLEVPAPGPRQPDLLWPHQRGWPREEQPGLRPQAEVMSPGAGTWLPSGGAGPHRPAPALAQSIPPFWG